MALSPAVDILDIVCSSLEVASGVVTLGDEDVVVHATLQWLVEWDWWALKASADPRSTQIKKILP